MADFEIRGGAGPYEAAAIVAVFRRLQEEAAAARAMRPWLPRPAAWVRAYQISHPDDPLPILKPDPRGQQIIR
ncbi:MAG TPA: hypothetical protein VLA54_04565 [Acidimicrobiia bacterium]|nr:hypothetical protein [Acidimicrobiia bacterium]